jgi:hypothetical protein
MMILFKTKQALYDKDCKLIFKEKDWVMTLPDLKDKDKEGLAWSDELEVEQ